MSVGHYSEFLPVSVGHYSEFLHVLVGHYSEFLHVLVGHYSEFLPVSQISRCIEDMTKFFTCNCLAVA